MTARAQDDLETAWMRVARGELGVTEHAGGPNDRIRQYLATVQAPDGANWCAAFAAWCLEQSGYSGPWTGAARSFQHVGQALDSFKPGCIVVLWRESPDSWMGHVAFGVREGATTLTLLGGNQGGAVRQSVYSRKRLLGYRWPL